MATTQRHGSNDAETFAIRDQFNAWLKRTIGEMQWLSRNIHEQKTPFSSAYDEDEAKEIAFRVSTSLDVLENMLERFDLPEPPPEFAKLPAS